MLRRSFLKAVLGLSALPFAPLRSRHAAPEPEEEPYSIPAFINEGGGGSHDSILQAFNVFIENNGPCFIDTGKHRPSFADFRKATVAPSQYAAYRG